MGEKANAHSLFRLTVANDGQIPIKMYIKLDLTFMGLKVPNVGMLIAQELNQVFEKNQTKLPGIVGSNLIWLSYNTFIQEYGTTGFHSFKCPEGVNPLLYSQLCVFHCSDVQKNQLLGTTSGAVFWQIKQTKMSKTDDLYKKDQQNFSEKDGVIGQVTIGSKQNPVFNYCSSGAN